MAKLPNLSRGEMVVARAIWELGEGGVGVVHEHIAQRQAMDYAAVQTYLRRLESKGYLKSRRDGRTKIYRPKLAAAQVLREAVGDLLRRLFDGEVLAMMHHLVRDHGIGPEEISQLRTMLDEAEGKGHES